MGFLDRLKGAVTGRGAHDHDDAHVAEGTPGSAHDPVCDMWVDPAKAKWKSDHAGKTMYFCSADCKTKFDADPHKYLGHHTH